MKKVMIVLAWLLFTGMAEAEGQPSPVLQNTGRESASRPNIIWIVLDACRPDHLSCYGYKRPTSPVIDGIARRGVLFENHFAQGLWTPISVPSFMTGRYYPTLSLDMGKVVDPRKVPVDEKLFPEILRNHGYSSLCVTTQAHIHQKTRFFNVFDEGCYIPCPPDKKKDELLYMDEINPLIIKKIESAKKPFFLYIHLMDTHFPHLLFPPYDTWLEEKDVGRIVGGRYANLSGKVLTEREKRHISNLYDGSILRADTAIGVLTARLESLGLLQNTIFVIGSDHGEALGEDNITVGHGNTSDDVMRVPLIMAGPGISGNQVISCLTENVDIVPTLCDLLGIRPEASFDGKSMMGIIDGSKKNIKEYVFCRDGSYEIQPISIVRDSRHKFIYNFLTGDRSLWECPDILMDRSQIKIRWGLKSKFMKIINRHIRPRWEAHESLRKKYFDINLGEVDLHGQLVAHDLFVKEHVPEKKRDHWRQTAKGIFGPSSEYGLESLSLEFKVPPGKYFVYVKPVVSGAAAEERRTSMRIKLENTEQEQVIITDPTVEPGENTGFYPVGWHDGHDGMLKITLAPAGEGGDVSVCQLRLVEENESFPESVEGDSEEQLRALGYL